MGYCGVLSEHERLIWHRFTGQPRDTETGLDHFGARYFGANLGRFASADAPLIDQAPGDPKSWNLYSYVRNNPLGFVDPTGLCVRAEDA
jgi:RHS repeat-associated protein